MADHEKKQKHWTVKGSEYVHRDQWIAVRADDCLTPDGVPVTPYYVLEYSDWVFVAAFDDEDRLLMVHLYRHGNSRVNLELPGGVVEPSDGSPVDAARRELMEETGCEAREVILLGSLTPNSATHTNRLHCCLALGVRQVREPDQDAAEDLESEWVSVDEVLKRVDRGEFSQALHLAVLFRALRYRGLV
jgi:8-oxo-dGTP pyrophosphatase MutT (NUDIX family)